MFDKTKGKIKKVWIAIANRTGLRVFKYEGHAQEASLVHTIDHPEGHLKDREIGTSQPGRAFDSIGNARHSMESHQSPSQHIAEAFAKNVAEFLEAGRVKKEYLQLVLIAEASFLGLLRQKLSTGSKNLLVHTENKDFGYFTEHELKAYLTENIHAFIKEKET